MKYFSTFTGIGGFEIGIEKAYESIYNKSKNEGLHTEENMPGDNSIGMERATCVGYSEINKYAVDIYQRHFNHKNYGDITKINEKELPDFDLFVGGFPCQAFSIAGLRRGFDDTRGTLFFDIARILKEKQPRNFILENVKGLLSHDGGQTFKTIVATLTELGYCVEWQVLNAKNFGVAQNRERIFIVGHFGGIPKQKVFPIGGSDAKDIEVSGVLDTETWRKRHEQIRRVHNIRGISPTIPTGTGGGVMTKIEVPTIIQKSPDYREDGTLRMFTENSPAIRSKMGDNHPMIIQKPRGKNEGGIYEESPTVSANAFQENNQLYQSGIVRRLTPLECERLMGYPDGWTEGLSDTQRYKTLGNGIVSNVVAEVVRKLYAQDIHS